MPWFYYKAVSEEGKLVEGELQATSHEAAIEWIQAHGQTPIRALERAPRKPGRGPKAIRLPRLRTRALKTDVSRFTRDLSTLLTAGVQLERALEILIELGDSAEAVGLLRQVLRDIRDGASLADALQAHPAAFSRFYVNMIRAGEAGGAVEEILARLEAFIGQYDELKSNVKSALIYPGILITVTVVSVIVLITFVVPQFATLFQDMGQELPLATRIVMGLGENLQRYGWIVFLLLTGLVYYVRRKMHEPAFRHRWDKAMLATPLLGDLIAKIEVVVFARTLGTLLASGIPLLSALEIVKETHTNRLFVDAVESISEHAAQGRGLAGPMMNTGQFPRLASHLVQVGEETGRLESTLTQLADIYDREIGTAIQRALALVEPVLIIGLGILVGGIIMSILVAVLSVNELAF